MSLILRYSSTLLPSIREAAYFAVSCAYSDSVWKIVLRNWLNETAVTTVAARPKISVTETMIFPLSEKPFFAIAARSSLSLRGLRLLG